MAFVLLVAILQAPKLELELKIAVAIQIVIQLASLILPQALPIVPLAPTVDPNNVIQPREFAKIASLTPIVRLETNATALDHAFRASPMETAVPTPHVAPNVIS